VRSGNAQRLLGRARSPGEAVGYPGANRALGHDGSEGRRPPSGPGGEHVE
jgi:hypothetical protein